MSTDSPQSVLRAARGLPTLPYAPAKTAAPLSSNPRAAVPGRTTADSSPLSAKIVRALRTLLHLWHLLSLDAPSIATLWTALIVRSVGLRPSAGALAAMFLAVWLLYAADRLLDARPLSRLQTVGLSEVAKELEERHRFHDRHRFGFVMAVTLVTGVLGFLLPSLPAASVQLDLVLGILVVGYFVVIHAAEGDRRLPKEIAVGLFFSAAVFVPAISQQPGLRVTLAPAALAFAALCSLNCVAIYAWEHPPGVAALRQTNRAHALTHLATSHLNGCCLCLCLGTLGLVARSGSSRLPCLAMAMAAGLLWLLHRARHRFEPVTLRALGDLALATPLLVWPWLG